MIHQGECRHCGQRLPHEAELCSACNRLWCRHCGCVTNHTTAQHEQEMFSCRGCGDDVRQWVREPEIDEENVECPACRQDRIEARVDEWYDALAKDSSQEKSND